MLTTVFATKLGMTQAWTKQGKRLAVTRCKVGPNLVVRHLTPVASASDAPTNPTQIELGYGSKKFKNLSKATQTRLQKAGISTGVLHMRAVPVQVSDGSTAAESHALGSSTKVEEVLQVGDVVKVQGISKGRGFAGAVKRHGFHGGPKTHGQSDRERAVGSIGSGTTPGRVFKGKRMAGHFGTDTITVSGLVVIKIDPTTQEVWLNGPVPGHYNSFVRINKTGDTKTVELFEEAAPVVEVAQSAPEVAEAKVEAVTEVEKEVAEKAETQSPTEEPAS